MSAAEAVPDRAAASKAAGTAAFKAGNFEEAVTAFSAAIEADPTNHVLYSNRSAAYAKQELYKPSLLDANKCIDLAPTWAKGHSRRGAAYVGLRNWRQAVVAYEDGLKHEPESAADPTLPRERHTPATLVARAAQPRKLQPWPPCGARR